MLVEIGLASRALEEAGLDDDVRLFNAMGERIIEGTPGDSSLATEARFKNVFRNRVMHNCEEYDRDQGHSAFVHVREFMRILANKISETRTAPMISS